MAAPRQPGDIDGRAGRLAGWTAFSAVILIVVGLFNLINGADAIHNANYFVSDRVYANLKFWGWIFLIWGVLQIVAGVLVATRHRHGRALGVSLAAIAGVLWFLMIFSEPWAALVGVSMSVLVLYGLSVGMADEYS